MSGGGDVWGKFFSSDGIKGMYIFGADISGQLDILSKTSIKTRTKRNYNCPKVWQFPFRKMDNWTLEGSKLDTRPFKAPFWCTQSQISRL